MREKSTEGKPFFEKKRGQTVFFRKKGPILFREKRGQILKFSKKRDKEFFSRKNGALTFFSFDYIQKEVENFISNKFFSKPRLIRKFWPVPLKVPCEFDCLTKIFWKSKMAEGGERK